MNGIEWGPLYNQFKDAVLDPDKLETELANLIQDDNVIKLSGIYPYVLTRQEKYLNLRGFDDKT